MHGTTNVNFKVGQLLLTHGNADYWQQCQFWHWQRGWNTRAAKDHKYDAFTTLWLLCRFTTSITLKQSVFSLYTLCVRFYVSQNKQQTSACTKPNVFHNWGVVCLLRKTAWILIYISSQIPSSKGQNIIPQFYACLGVRILTKSAQTNLHEEFTYSFF
jgi:hypothetical protein